MTWADGVRRVKAELPAVLAAAGTVLAAFAVLRWGFRTEGESRSFLIGYAAGAASLYLHLRDTRAGAGLDAEGERLERERQRAEVACARWAARLRREEVRRLRRSRRDEGWRGDP